MSSVDPDKAYNRTTPSEFGGHDIGVHDHPPGQPERYQGKAASLGGKPPKHQRRVG